jgi:hypothetical protein
MYYHFAILLLFRPLIKLRIIGSCVSPRDVCSQAADAISGLLRSYSQLYTLRRTPSFVPYFVLTSSIMHLAIGATSPGPPHTGGGGESSQSGQSPQQSHQGRGGNSAKVGPHAAEAINRGIADLTEMAPCHHFADQALNILRYLAKKWNIDVEVEVGAEAGQQRAEGPNDPTRPVTSSLNFFAPNVTESDFSCSWGEATEPGAGMDTGRAGVGGGDIGQMATALENPLFWPFPMQGRPMLPTGQELEEAGFELL